ncbi:unnamed protein product [Adineta steineri]|uniref:Uncharacterized protein n=1 Tax=Adineta steineri TaxID=433720 RepID=A0A818I4D2_9BILA|nr:unnamed protein product [Adineta steineri]CAF1296723.1 unnamed protein product [Adineta steineri]CAF3519537.1 unnamed protein product [Adineta steineri]CAF3565362.1 unnamed protein product [Adineta steineri]CAF3919264.1 unnamed protein product [Adineta steineri]
MKNFHLLILLFFIVSLLEINAQWFIIKKDYPAHLMNYPNPGKRSLSEDELNIDCSIPYSYLNTYEGKTAWLLSCNDKQSSLTSNYIDNELNYIPQFIYDTRRTQPSIPSSMNEQQNLFNIKLLKRLRQSINK